LPKNIKNIPSHSVPLMKQIFARPTLKILKIGYLIEDL